MGLKTSSPPLPGLLVRRVALKGLEHVFVKKQALDVFFEKEPGIDALEDRDRAFAYFLVTTTVRHFGLLSGMLEGFLKKPFPSPSHRGFLILALGAAQLVYGKTPIHAVVSTSLALAKAHVKTRFLSKLIHGVLREVSTRGEDCLPPPENRFPPWIRRRWERIYGEDEVRKMARCLDCPPTIDLTFASLPDALSWSEGGRALRLEGEGIPPFASLRVEGSLGNLASWPGYREGTWWVQDIAASLVVRLGTMGQPRGLRVLDLCAAPGGKTAQLVTAGFEVTCVDKSPARLKRLGENLARLGLKATCIAADIRTFTPEAPFDLVVLDAPCSATGTVFKNPDLLWIKDDDTIVSCARLQAVLLEKSAAFVRPGGRLVYSTCSLEPEEGEGQIAAFLKTTAGRAFTLSPLDAPWASALLTPEGTMRTTLSSSLGTFEGMDGFFLACLDKSDAKETP